jgi:hypothetical protein
MKLKPNVIIDIYRGEFPVDFERAADEQWKAVWLQMTYGRTTKDEKCAVYINEAEKRGIPWFLYHFATPNFTGDQINNILTSYKILGVDPAKVPVCIDIEHNPGPENKRKPDTLPRYSDWTNQLDKIVDATGITWGYTNAEYARWCYGGSWAAFSQKLNWWIGWYPYPAFADVNNSIAKYAIPQGIVPQVWQYAGEPGWRNYGFAANDYSTCSDEVLKTLTAHKNPPVEVPPAGENPLPVPPTPAKRLSEALVDFVHGTVDLTYVDGSSERKP